MTDIFDRIVSNARNGKGPCRECPAQLDSHGEFVNPGLIDPNGDLMFLTMDPSHHIDWSDYSSWAGYNDEKSRLFIEEWPGGKSLQKLLDGIPNISIREIWLADAVKCPVNNQRAGDVDSDVAFSHCVNYLQDEISKVDPKVIITMGADPVEQLLGSVFDIHPPTLKPGTRDAGRTFDTDPPVVVSPHWGHGWLGRNNNREKVQSAITSNL